MYDQDQGEHKDFRDSKPYARRHVSVCRSLLLNLFIFASVAVCVGANAPPTLRDFLALRLSKNPIWVAGNKNPATVDDICPVGNDVFVRRVFAEYGAVFAAGESVTIPWACVFSGHSDVEKFQKTLKKKSLLVENAVIELQEPAADALHKAINEASARNIRLLPLEGAIAGGRTYYQTLHLWASRFFPALDHWVKNGRITEEEAMAARSLNTRRQVLKVMEWEEQGIYFSRDLTRSIFSSAAPPGTSQHLSLLALDVQNYYDAQLRAILATNGWYQTVINDPTHFTYLGVTEADLPGRGLLIVIRGPYRFWVPRL